jgi:putative oxygen-independent coproporphyrinogen III oxidase
MINKVPLSIYIHWPFCTSKCPYCDFNSHIKQNINQQEWGKCLVSELNYITRTYFSNNLDKYYLKSIFFGGGTPSLIESSVIKKIIKQCIKKFKYFSSSNEVEITLEANPNSLTKRKLLDFRDAGINRISIGAQSFDKKFLEFLGRDHSVYEAKRNIEHAREVFKNVSFDLIYAMPNQTIYEWEKSLKTAFQFEPDHLSLYQLTIEEGTAFNQMFRKGKLIPIDNGLASEMYSITENLTQKNKLPAYEVSNYSKKGKNCSHNLNYWEGGEWIGIGPGAVSRFFYNNKRTQLDIRKDPNGWINSVKDNGNGVKNIASETIEDFLNERLLMGLRLVKGVNIKPIKGILNMAKVYKLIETNYLHLKNGTMKTTFNGRLRLNSILTEIIK